MLFLLRAAVVIGGLSYLAVLRERPDTGPALSAPVPPIQALAAAWDAVPDDSRERIVRDGMRDGMDALARRVGPQPPASADTLAEADRRPPWRGVAAR